MNELIIIECLTVTDSVDSNSEVWSRNVILCADIGGIKMMGWFVCVLVCMLDWAFLCLFSDTSD